MKGPESPIPLSDYPIQLPEIPDVAHIPTMQLASLEYRALRDQLQRDIAAHIGAVARRLREPSADNQRAAERSFEQLGTTFEAGELAFEQLDGLARARTQGGWRDTKALTDRLAAARPQLASSREELERSRFEKAQNEIARGVQIDGPQPTIHTAPADPVTRQVSERRQRRWGARPDELKQWSHVLNQEQASPNPPPAAPSLSATASGSTETSTPPRQPATRPKRRRQIVNSIELMMGRASAPSEHVPPRQRTDLGAPSRGRTAERAPVQPMRRADSPPRVASTSSSQNSLSNTDRKSRSRR
jgi:hypothetical protein